MIKINNVVFIVFVFTFINSLLNSKSIKLLLIIYKKTQKKSKKNSVHINNTLNFKTL